MGDWPASQDYNRVTISTGHPESVGTEIRMFMGKVDSGFVSSAWPTTNRAIYIPFVVFQPFTVDLMMVHNGATASGNIDVGIYDDQQNRLVSMGSTAQSGTSAIQSFDITDTLLKPGVYYMAVAMDNTTGTLFAFVPSNKTIPGGMGVLAQSTAFALPSPAVFVAAADAYVPDVTVTGRTLI